MIPCQYRHKWYIAKTTDSLSYISVIVPKSTEFGEITRWLGLLRRSRSSKVTEFGTSYLTPFPSYGWLLVKFPLARVECLTLTLSLGVTPCQYRHKWYIAKTTDSLGYISAAASIGVSSTTGTFSNVIRPEIYRIRRNYAAVRAITPFKVI